MKNNIFDDIKDHSVLLSTGSSRTDESIKNHNSFNIANRLTFVLFKEIIDISPLQTRETIFDPNVSFEDKELLESISKVGIITPIIVRELSENDVSKDIFYHRSFGERKFGLVAGHRRVVAGQAAGLKGTEGVILKAGDDHELITLAENMGRKELTPYENALALKNLSERRSLTIRGVSNATGYSKTHVHRLYLALNSPKSLRNLWIEGELSASTIVVLKEHWPEFTEEKAGQHREKIRKLTRSAAKELADQLNAGTPLEPALNTLCSMGSQGLNSTTSKDNQQKTESNKQSPSSQNRKQNSFMDDKKAVVSVIRDVFYRFSEKKANDLYYLAIANTVKDPDVFWAASLYVSMGGDIELAFNITQRIMSNRIYRGVMNRQIKNFKKVSGILKSKKPNQSTIEFFKIIFPGVDHPSRRKTRSKS